jgi:hypothetical protein
MSVHRFWRDLGTPSEFSAGLIADHFGFATAILGIGALMFLAPLLHSP